MKSASDQPANSATITAGERLTQIELRYSAPMDIGETTETENVELARRMVDICWLTRRLRSADKFLAELANNIHEHALEYTSRDQALSAAADMIEDIEEHRYDLHAPAVTSPSTDPVANADETHKT
jgi:ferritin-like metal-binding protein YciE